MIDFNFQTASGYTYIIHAQNTIVIYFCYNPQAFICAECWRKTFEILCGVYSGLLFFNLHRYKLIRSSSLLPAIISFVYANL